jgi:hypothetical protein
VDDFVSRVIDIGFFIGVVIGADIGVVIGLSSALLYKSLLAFLLVSPLVLSLFHLAGAGAAQSRLSAAHEAGPGMGLCRKGQSGADRHAGKPAVSSS